MKKIFLCAATVFTVLSLAGASSAASVVWDFEKDATDFRDKNALNLGIDAANGGYEGTFDQVYGGPTSTKGSISLSASAFRGFDINGVPDSPLVEIGNPVTSREPITTFMDAGNAGLGVCSTGFDATENNGSTTGESRCSTQYGGSPKDAGDDNLVFPEILKLAFSGVSAVTIDGLLVRNGKHKSVDGDILISTTGLEGSFVAYSMTAGVVDDLSGLGAASMFWFTSTQNDPAPEIYLETLTVSAVPVPAALPLLLAGIGGLGFIGRRRRKAA